MFSGHHFQISSAVNRVLCDRAFWRNTLRSTNFRLARNTLKKPEKNVNRGEIQKGEKETVIRPKPDWKKKKTYDWI